jgi:ADP-ribose pyrophosphatase YjhB (NUDIX family)
MSKQHTSVRSYGVLISEGRVALVRSSNPHHVPPLWWLPGGGIDFGEAPEDSLVREFKEETGLEIHEPVLLGVTSDVRRRDNGDKIHTVRILFTAELKGGELSHEIHGTTDHAAWFDLADLESLNVADYARAAIEAAQPK